MLILTRRVGETVFVAIPPGLQQEEITITILGVKGNQVRVGIHAAKSIAVHREEIYERIKRENAQYNQTEKAKSHGTERQL